MLFLPGGLSRRRGFKAKTERKIGLIGRGFLMGDQYTFSRFLV